MARRSQQKSVFRSIAEVSESTSLAIETKDREVGETHSHHTLIKVHLKRFESELKNGKMDFTDSNFQQIVRNIEVPFFPKVYR